MTEYKTTGNWKVVWILFLPVFKVEVKYRSHGGDWSLKWKVANRMDYKLLIDSLQK